MALKEEPIFKCVKCGKLFLEKDAGGFMAHIYNNCNGCRSAILHERHYKDEEGKDHISKEYNCTGVNFNDISYSGSICLKCSGVHQ